MNPTEAKVLAQALYEIRGLLASYLGSNAKDPLEVRVAAHLAYALHNEALAVIRGQAFDVHAARAKVRIIDGVLGVDEGAHFANKFE